MYKYYRELCNSYQANNISKDKIKAKIEQIDYEYNKTLEKDLSLEMHNYNCSRHEAMRMVLQELLEE